MRQNKYYRYYRVADGHKGFSAKRRRESECGDRLASLREDYERLCAEERYCECGCGERLKPTVPSFDQFIRQRKRTYQRFLWNHQNRPRHWKLELEPGERSAILGTLLGDASLLYPHGTSEFPRLSFNHSVKQAEWAKHKRDFLHRLVWRENHWHNERGYGGPIVNSVCSCLPAFKPIHDLCYDGSKKRVTREWLDELGAIGLAWWIGDDGSGASGLNLHTEGYSFDDVDLIAEWIGDKYGSCVAKLHKGKYKTIHMRAEAFREVFKLVDPFVPKCMGYKLESCRRSVADGRRPRHVRPDRG